MCECKTSIKVAGSEFVGILPKGCQVLSMVEHKGRIVLATNQGVMQMVWNNVNEYELRPIRFAYAKTDA